MATTITPSIGAGALFTQQGQGTTPGYSAIDLRRSDSLGLQEGVYGATDFMVVQRGAGANMSVDITMPTGGFACVQGDSVFGQGLYTVPTHSTATVNETLAAADATNPRIDSVILEVLDNVHDASGNNLARTRVLTGTPTAATTLTSRVGAVTLPANALLFADILVGAGVTSVDNTKIRDRRKWARGAYCRIIRTTGDVSTSNTGTKTAIDAVNLAPRIECSGGPLRVTLQGSTFAGAGIASSFDVMVDGALQSISQNQASSTANAAQGGAIYDVVIVPSPGSHTIAPAWNINAAGSATLNGTAANPAILAIEEIVRQNTANNTTTSG